MKRHLILAGLLAFATVAQAQNIAEPDYLDTKCGDKLTVQPIVHGSVVLTQGDQTIFVDPYGGSNAYQDMPNPTIIIITDIHGDHLHPETLEGLNTDGTTLVVPQAVADQLPEKFAENKVVILDNGDKKKVNGLRITAIPMYNLPESEDSRHTKGRGNGYLINFCGTTVYLSGDTEDIVEMRELEEVDIAFVCMNLPYTMDINQAASAVLEFVPGIVYPYHYRGQDGLSDVEQFQELVQEGNEAIDVRLRNWYPGN